MNISDIGSTADTALLCYTNRPPPPGKADSGGDWFAPDGMVLDKDSEIERGPMVVKLRSVHNIEGVYKCVVQDRSMINKTVYIGVYLTSSIKGMCHMRCDVITFANHFIGVVKMNGSINFSLNSILNQFTLTCISTGGPATTVIWTRDSTNVTEGTKTVLDNGVTAHYTHTLLVKGRQEGVYRCTVKNIVSNNSSAELIVEGKLRLTIMMGLYASVYFQPQLRLLHLM